MSAISPIVQQMRGPLETTPQETAQQNKTGYLTSGKDITRAMRDSLTGENSLEVEASGDTVNISEKGRAMQQTMAAKEKEKGPDGETSPGVKESVHASGVAGGDGEAASSTDQIAELRRQIQDVQKQIAQAKQRLSQAEGASAEAAAGVAPVEAAEAPEATSPENGSGEETAAAPAQGTAGGKGENSEARAIKNEINTLEMQLQTLQYKLMEMSQGGSGSKAMGTAGIGGEGTGEGGGLGERISVG